VYETLVVHHPRATSLHPSCRTLCSRISKICTHPENANTCHSSHKHASKIVMFPQTRCRGSLSEKAQQQGRIWAFARVFAGPTVSPRSVFVHVLLSTGCKLTPVHLWRANYAPYARLPLPRRAPGANATVGTTLRCGIPSQICC